MMWLRKFGTVLEVQHFNIFFLRKKLKAGFLMDTGPTFHSIVFGTT